MNFFIIGTDLNFNEIIKGSKQIPVKLHDATSELLRVLAIRRNLITSEEIKNRGGRGIDEIAASGFSSNCLIFNKSSFELMICLWKKNIMYLLKYVVL